MSDSSEQKALTATVVGVFFNLALAFAPDWLDVWKPTLFALFLAATVIAGVWYLILHYKWPKRWLRVTLVIVGLFLIVVGLWIRVPQTPVSKRDAEQVPQSSVGDPKPEPQPKRPEEVQVVLRQASSAGHVGQIFPRKDEWYWLILNLTVVNQGDDADTVSFELAVPTATGVTKMLQPTTLPPAELKLSKDVRLLGVENLTAKAAVTGSLLFRLDRLNFPALKAVDGAGKEIATDHPNTTGSFVIVSSELFPERKQREFDALSLLRRSAPAEASSLRNLKPPTAAPPAGLRAREIVFSEPKAGQRMAVEIHWENTSDNNVTAGGKSIVYTIGLAEGEQLPITPDSEAAFEDVGDQELRVAAVEPRPAETPPGARFVTVHRSDPKRPLTPELVAELLKGRARVYVKGYMRWIANGAEHGCDFCAWTSEGGYGRLTLRGNRCY